MVLEMRLDGHVPVSDEQLDEKVRRIAQAADMEGYYWPKGDQWVIDGPAGTAFFTREFLHNLDERRLIFEYKMRTGRLGKTDL